MADWCWNPESARYHDLATGRFMPRSEVLNYVNDSLVASGNATDVLAQLVSDGTLSPADWNGAMRQEVKEEYIRQYILGRGGLEQMTSEDWGSIGGSLVHQYHPYLDGFTQDIASGKLSEAQIRARAKMYTNSAGQAFERGKARASAKAGLDEVKWTLTPAEHCVDCEALAAMGWQPVADDPFGGCFPRSGCTQCLSNCKCILDYRKFGEEEE